MNKPFEKLNKESAVDIRARLDGLEEVPGYKLLKVYFENRAKELKLRSLPLTNNDFASVNQHNRRLYMAEAFEEVLQWVQDAKGQCDSFMKGDK